MLKASSIVYALFVVTILTIISASIVLSSYYYNLQLIDYTQRIKQQSYVQSGVNLLLSDQQIENPFSEERKLFDDELSTVSLSKKWWGMMEVITVESTWKKNTVGKAYLLGYKERKSDRVALYLKDNNRPLSLSGKTIVKGTVYLPKSGVKRAYIEGQGFVGTKLIDGKILESSEQLTKLNHRIVDELLNNFTSISMEDSILSLEELYQIEFLRNGFTSRKIVVELPDQINLSQLNITGNVCLKSKGTVYLDATCNLKDVIIFARKIVFQKAFKGELQAFATDTILVEENCQFSYPSVLGLLANEESSRQYLALEKGCELFGAVFQYPKEETFKNNSFIKFEKESVVQGIVYSPGQLYLGGNVFGSAFVGSFVLSTPSSIYENHLLNTEINSLKLSDDFVGIEIPFANKKPTKEIVCEFEL